MHTTATVRQLHDPAVPLLPRHERLTRGTILRLGAGALVASAALGALPSLASADTHSSCVYNTDNDNVVVSDHSGSGTLQIVRKNQLIMVADGVDAVPKACFSAPIDGVSTLADVDNTVRVTVFAAPAEVAGGYTVDQSKGTFARTNKTGPQSPSNIPITLDTTGVPAPELTVIGTAGPDVMRAGAGGKVNLSFGDSNADVIPLVKPVDVVLRGGAGNDDLNGIGIADSGPGSAPADTGLRLEGDAGSDNLVASQREPSPRSSILLGGNGDDTLFSANRHSDGVSGGSGIDTATTDAFGDVVLSVENHLFL